MTMKEKLKAITSDEKSEWVTLTKEKLAHTGARKNARAVALRVLDILEAKGMTQTELADKMGVSRQQVTKIVKGRENFTFETIDKLEKALQTKLMTIAGSQEEQPPFPAQDADFELPVNMVAAAFGHPLEMIVPPGLSTYWYGVAHPSFWPTAASLHSITFAIQPARDFVLEQLRATTPRVHIIEVKKGKEELSGIIKPSQTSDVEVNMS